MKYQYLRKQKVTVDTLKGMVVLEIGKISRITTISGGTEFHMMNGDSVTNSWTLKKVCVSLDCWGIIRLNKQCAVNMMQEVHFDCCRTLTIKVVSKTKKGEMDKIDITCYPCSRSSPDECVIYLIFDTRQRRAPTGGRPLQNCLPAQQNYSPA
jgi:hypothetical protein